jgi:hypothetical protein
MMVRMRIRHARGLAVAAGVGLVALGLAQSAGAATVIARGARWEAIRVNKIGVADVTYYAYGRTNHTLVWGARNALPPSRSTGQVRFHVNYAGGYRSFLGSGYWRKVVTHNVCGAYRGPALWRMVAACTMPDGSNWALQSWQSDLPDNGWQPGKGNITTRLFVSHWSGALPKLWFKADWIYYGAPNGPYDNIYGNFTYHGKPVYGFSSTARGAPTDSYGRLVAIDTQNPPWYNGYRQRGGWWRQNSFLSHRPYGDFCTGIYGGIAGVPRRSRPGAGQQYRIMANGPGVTPVVEWHGAPPGYYQPGLSNLFPQHDYRGPYNGILERELNADQRALEPVMSGGSNSCWNTH